MNLYMFVYIVYFIDILLMFTAKIPNQNFKFKRKSQTWYCFLFSSLFLCVLFHIHFCCAP